MPATIIASKEPCAPAQRASLEALFASPGLLLLKEVIASRCIGHQVEAMNAKLYSENDHAQVSAALNTEKAAKYNQLLDLLYDLEAEQNWFTVKLEVAR